jgi:hypothetical protein
MLQPQPQDMLELLPLPPPILLEQDLIYKTEAVLLVPLYPSPPAAAAAPTAPPSFVTSPPAARVNMFTHTMAANNNEAVDLDRRMSVLSPPSLATCSRATLLSTDLGGSAPSARQLVAPDTAI